MLFIGPALRHGCSPVSLLHISRTPFSNHASGWLLLAPPSGENTVESNVVRKVVRQHIYIMFISNNRTSFHLSWKQNLIKHKKVSKYYKTGCSAFLQIFFSTNLLVRQILRTSVFLISNCLTFPYLFISLNKELPLKTSNKRTHISLLTNQFVFFNWAKGVRLLNHWTNTYKFKINKITYPTQKS